MGNTDDYAKSGGTVAPIFHPVAAAGSFFEGSSRSKRRKKRRKEAIARENRARGGILSLLEQVGLDDTISDITKEELLGSLNTARNYDVTGSEEALSFLGDRFARAQQGIDPMFKSRQNVQAMHETLIDTPGRSQTIASNQRKSNSFIG